MKYVRGLIVTIGVAIGLSFANTATFAVPFSTGGLSIGSLGWDGSYGDSTYDILNLAAKSDSFDGPGSIVLNNATFTAGANSSSGGSYSGVLSQLLTVDGETQTLNMPYNIIISSSDTLTILGGATLYFTGGWTVVLDALVLGPNGGGAITGYLTAQVSQVVAAAAVAETPLPAAVILFGTVLGGAGLLMGRGRRRRMA